jgi:hypothetical protein
MRGNARPDAARRPLEQRKFTGAKPPLRPEHVCSIRTKLHVEGRARDLAMFNLAMDSKLRGWTDHTRQPVEDHRTRQGIGKLGKTKPLTGVKNGNDRFGSFPIELATRYSLFAIRALQCR